MPASSTLRKYPTCPCWFTIALEIVAFGVGALFAIASTVTVLLGVRRVPQPEPSVVAAKWDDTAQNGNPSDSESVRTSPLELAEAS